MYGKLLKSIFIVIILLLGAGNACAQVDSLGMAVSPQIFELDFFLGESTTQKIKIRNTSEVAMPINVIVTNFSAAEESGEMFFNESAGDISIDSSQWLKMETPNFILAPGEKKDVHFSINIPENAEPGGYYVAALFEPQLPSFYFKESQPRSIPVVGVLFLLSVKALSLEPVALNEQIEIVEFGVPKEQRMQNLEKVLASIVDVVPMVSAKDISLVEKTPSSFVLRIKNSDIFHHKLKGKLAVYDAFGNKVGETDIKRTTILPGKTRRFPVELQPQESSLFSWLPASVSDFLVQNTSLGNYKAELTLEVDNFQDERLIFLSTDFWSFPWKISLILLFSAGILFLTRRRMLAVIKALLKPRSIS